MNFLRPLHPRPHSDRTYRAAPAVVLLTNVDQWGLQSDINDFLDALGLLEPENRFFLDDIQYQTTAIANILHHSALLRYQVWTPV